MSEIRARIAIYIFAIILIVSAVMVIGLAALDGFTYPDSRLFGFFVRLFGGRTYALIFLTVTGVGLLFMSAWFILVACQKIAELTSYIKAKEHTEHALVVSKMQHNEVNQLTKSLHTIYYVAFDFPDGSRKNFTVEPIQFNTIIEGESGMLTYKKRDNHLFFLHFSRM